MAADGASPAHPVAFRDAKHFLQEYTTNLEKGSLVAAIPAPPGMGMPCQVELWLPADQGKLLVQATVILPTPGFVVLQIQADEATKAALAATAAACRQLSPEAASAPLPQPAAAAAPTPAQAPEPSRPQPHAHQHLRPHTARPAPQPAPAPAPQLAPAPQPTPAPAPAPEPAPASLAMAADPFSDEWSGQIAENPIEHVFSALGHDQAGGRLTIHGENEDADIFFDRGNILGVIERPEVPAHRVGEMLVRTGKLRSRDRDIAVHQAAEDHVPIGQVLLKRGFAEPAALRAALQQQLLDRINAQLKRRSGRFEFKPGVRPPRPFGTPPMPAAAAIFRGKVELYMQRTPAEVEKFEEEIFWLYVHRAQDAPEELGPRGLDRDEQRYWNLVITGQYTLRETYAVSDLGRRKTHAVNMALIDVGLAKLEHKMHARFRLAKMEVELERKLSQIGAGTHFDTLDVHWMATSEDIEEGWRTLRNTFDTTELGIPVPPKVQAMSEEVLAAGDRALEALTNHRGRMEYRRTILEQAQIDNALEILVRQGSIDLYRGSLRDAEYRYAHIVELDPSNIEAKRALVTIRARREAQAAGKDDMDDLVDD